MPDPLTTLETAADVTMFQVLDAEGRRRESPGGEPFAPYVAELTDDLVRAMYRDMVLTRAFDAQATSLQRQGELGLWAPSLGQEGAQIGSAHALRRRDYVFPSYREHGVAHVRGMDLSLILPLFRGTQHGGWNVHTHNFHLYSIVIGSHALHAVGYGMGIQRDGDVGTGETDRDRAVVCYFGDGASSQGDVNEALVFAASTAAPVVFFVQNNQWAISVPAATQSPVALAQRGSGFGIPSVSVDGNDPLACYAVSRAALDRARSGGGPTFIEAVTYRMGPHTTSDDPTRYRDPAELEAWRTRDPIARVEAYLRGIGEIDDEQIAAAAADADTMAREMRAACLGMVTREPLAVFDGVYAEPHRGIDRQREEYSAYLASFEEA